MLKVFFLCLLYFTNNICSQEASLPDSLLTDEPIKNPSYSVTLSLLYPGAGQIYNESYLRSAAYFTTFSYFLYNAYLKNKSIDDIRSGKQNHIFPSAESRSAAVNRAYDRRNVWLWRALGVYVLNVMDAYAGAYLFRFDDIMDSDKDAELSFRQRSLSSIELNLKIIF